MKVFINSYYNDVILKSQNQCNGICSDEQYNNFLMNNFITWFNSWDAGFSYYHGTLNPDGTYNWIRVN